MASEPKKEEQSKPEGKGPKIPKILQSKKNTEKVEETRAIDGFFVPKYYRQQSAYRSNPLFRATLLVFLLTLAAGGAGGYQWLLANQIRKTALATQTMMLTEATRLQNQTQTLKPVREKYRELEVLRRQMRIPSTPILDAIEKTIPEKVSINRLTLICTPTSSNGPSKRKAQITAEVYFPSNVDPNDLAWNNWPKTLAANLSANGLKLSKSDWSSQRPYNPPENLIGRIKNPGWVKDLNLTVELAQ